MNDLIYKSAVIDILNEGAELLRHTLEEVDVIGAERVKYEYGLGLIEACIADVKELQPALVDKSGEENEQNVKK